MNKNFEEKRPAIIWAVIIVHFLVGSMLLVGFLTSIPGIVKLVLQPGKGLSGSQFVFFVGWYVIAPTAFLLAAFGLYFEKPWVRHVYMLIAIVAGVFVIGFLPLIFANFSPRSFEPAASGLLLLSSMTVLPILIGSVSIVSAVLVRRHFHRIANSKS